MDDMKEDENICAAKDCTNKATEPMGPMNLCNHCFIKVAYDQIPLALKTGKVPHADAA